MHIFDFFNVLHLRARKIIGWKNSQEFQICIQHQCVPLNSFNYRLHSITFLRPFYALFARSIISANIWIAIIWISPSLLWCPCCCETNMCEWWFIRVSSLKLSAFQKRKGKKKTSVLLISVDETLLPVTCFSWGYSITSVSPLCRLINTRLLL